VSLLLNAFVALFLGFWGTLFDLPTWLYHAADHADLCADWCGDRDFRIWAGRWNDRAARYYRQASRLRGR
jgi:hypothetical protein